MADSVASGVSKKSSRVAIDAVAEEQDAWHDGPKPTRKRKRKVQCDQRLLRPAIQSESARNEKHSPQDEGKVEVDVPETTILRGTGRAPRKKQPARHKEPERDDLQPQAPSPAVALAEQQERRGAPSPARTAEVSDVPKQQREVVQEVQELAESLPPEVKQTPEPLELSQEKPKRRGRPPKAKASASSAPVKQSKPKKTPAVAASTGSIARENTAPEAVPKPGARSEAGEAPRPRGKRSGKGDLLEVLQHPAQGIVSAASETLDEVVLPTQRAVDTEQSEAVLAKPRPTRSTERQELLAAAAPAEAGRAVATSLEPKETSTKQQRKPPSNERSKPRTTPAASLTGGDGEKMQGPAKPCLKAPRQPRAALQPVSPNTSPERQKIRVKAMVETWQPQDWFKASVPSTLVQASDPRLRFRF